VRTRWCNRVWTSRHGGFHLCWLTAGHGGTRCIDTYANVSHPTADTEPSAWERAMARKAASDRR